MQPNPDTSTASLTRGLWFVFDHAGHRIALWASALTSKEELYVDGRLVSASRSFRFSSKHVVELDGRAYEVTLRLTRSPTGVMACELLEDGRKVAGYQTRYVKPGPRLRIAIVGLSGAITYLSIGRSAWWWLALLVLVVGSAWAMRVGGGGLVVVPMPADDPAPDAAGGPVASPDERHGAEPPPLLHLGRWLKQGARTAFLRPPDWAGLRATASLVALLLLVALCVDIVVQRLYTPGPVLFFWPALQSGWWGLLLALWGCWIVTRRPADVPGGQGEPGPMALFAMLLAQLLTLQVVLGAVAVPLVRAGWWPDEQALPARWALWVGPLAWSVAAQCFLLWRQGAAVPAVRAAVCLLLAASVVTAGVFPAARFWYPVQPEIVEAPPARLKLTPEILDRQPALLAERLQGLAPQRPGIVDVYAITYAPYADEEVFRRESAMVANVMETRFGAGGRTVQLVNNPHTAAQFPWATPLNLQRAIQSIAATMDGSEDILLIHLTSHGARDGSLATQHEPLTIESLTPQDLVAMLDAAGVRYRIVSVSACYAGSWIEPLARDTTLVMTAADAEHTSYGCGRSSELTYFGRAMFDEQLRQTWSFEDAHAKARRVIDEREKAAGKRDGYSNPQIRVGEGMRPQLTRLERELGARPGN